MRYAAGIEYLGTRYAGWQAQPATVTHPKPLTHQGTLEHALAQIAAQPVATICAGRTDAGVHASAQVVHFDTTATRDTDKWLLGTNRFLPTDMSVQWVVAAPDHFHARYSATSRRYRYLIDNRRARSALHAARATPIYQALDVSLMHTGAQYLLGENDFTSFRSNECQSRTAMRHISEIHVQRFGDFVSIEIEGNAFLHHMVRNIAGSLLLVGRGIHPPAWIAELLAARNRALAGMTAPPQGLTLIAVRYPTEFALPAPQTTYFLLP